MVLLAKKRKYKQNVLQRAEKALNFWEPKDLWFRILQRDIDANDLEALEYHLNQARAEQDMIEHAERVKPVHVEPPEAWEPGIAGRVMNRVITGDATRSL